MKKFSHFAKFFPCDNLQFQLLDCDSFNSRFETDDCIFDLVKLQSDENIFDYHKNENCHPFFAKRIKVYVVNSTVKIFVHQ